MNGSWPDSKLTAGDVTPMSTHKHTHTRAHCMTAVLDSRDDEAPGHSLSLVLIPWLTLPSESGSFFTRFCNALSFLLALMPGLDLDFSLCWSSFNILQLSLLRLWFSFTTSVSFFFFSPFLFSHSLISICLWPAPVFFLLHFSSGVFVQTFWSVSWSTRAAEQCLWNSKQCYPNDALDYACMWFYWIFTHTKS